MGIVPLLNELHFLTLHSPSKLQMGSDLLFWLHFTQALKRIIFKDHYIPALKYRPLARLKSPGKKAASKKVSSGRSSGLQKAAGSQSSEQFTLYSGWEFIGDDYETLLEQYVEYMPLLCAAGFAVPRKDPQLYNPLTLLHHFSECLLAEVVTHTRFTQAFEKTVIDSVLDSCLNLHVWVQQTGLEQYQQWQTWRDRIVRTQTDQPFHLYFHLLDPVNSDDPWQLQFEVAPKNDPYLKLSLDDYWRMGKPQQKKLKSRLGSDFEQTLLLNLGYASRIYPALWQGLETDQPMGIQLALGEDFDFNESSQRVVTHSHSPDRSWMYDALGNEITVFDGHFFSFSDDGKQIAIYYSSENQTRLYDLSGNELAALEGNFSEFRKEGQRLVTYSNSDDKTRLYDLSGNELAALEGFFGVFSDDGQRLVTYSESDEKARLYDLSGNELAALEGNFRGFSDDGQQFAVYSSQDQRSRLYSLSGQPTNVEIKGLYSEFSPNQQYIVTTVASEDISLIYDTAGNLLAEYPGSLSSDGQGSDLGFTPDSSQLITQSNDGLYHVWQLDDGLDDLLASGCEWARPYLQVNRDTETRAAFCLTDY